MLHKTTQKRLVFPLLPTIKSCLLSSLNKQVISFITGFFLLFQSTAQITDPRVDCTNGCTSNDVQIKTAYLVESTSPYDKLTSGFHCQGTADVKLALDLTTKTPRYGVYIYARVVKKSDPTIIYATVSECFSTPLASGGITKVVFNQAINWPCGTEIILKDVFIGWGTGNTDFCQGASTPRCPATPSKCFALPPGEYITIVIPIASSTSTEECSDAPGGTTATFDLTALNDDVIGNQTNVSVTWYSNIGLTNAISNPAAFVSGYAEVYAKVSNNSDPTAYTSATVILTVNTTPTVTSTSSTLCSTSPGGSTASFNLSGLESTIKNGQTDVSVSWYSDAALSSAISSPYVTATTTVYAKVINTNATSCYNSVAVNLTVNRTPTATAASATLCSSAAGGVTASFSLSDLEATVKGGQENVTVTWYSNVGLSSIITSPYVTGTTTVYAKVANSNAAGCYSSVAVPLTVNTTPTASAASATLCSSTAGGSTASFNLTSLEATIKNGQSNVAVTWYSNSGLTIAIASPYVSGTTTVYAKVANSSATNCYSSVAVPLTVNTTPTATVTSATLCSADGAGTTASFNLTSLEAAIINGQSNVAVTWYSNIGLSNAISSPYNTATTTVYAKVTNTNATSCYSSAAIGLTVNSRPGAITADVTQPTCGVPKGIITVTSSLTGLTFSLNSTNPADFTNATGVFSDLAPGIYTIRSKTTAGCISDGVAKEVLAVPDGTPAADVIFITNPSCSSSTGTLKVVKAGSLAEYDNTVFEFNNGGGWTSNPVFSFTAGAGYSITVRRIADHTCTATTSCEGEAPITTAAPVSAAEGNIEQLRISVPASVGVKTIPNPFTDRVRFAVTAEQAGNGSLDVFNMQGQKVITVYNGFVPAGTSYYDLQLTGRSSGQLIYVLRIGNQKISGKLIQLNR